MEGSKSQTKQAEIDIDSEHGIEGRVNRQLLKIEQEQELRLASEFVQVEIDKPLIQIFDQTVDERPVSPFEYQPKSPVEHLEVKATSPKPLRIKK